MASRSLPRAALVALVAVVALGAALATPAQAQVGVIGLPDPVTELRYQAEGGGVPDPWRPSSTCSRRDSCPQFTAGPESDPADVPAWGQELPVYRAMVGADGVVEKTTTFYASNAAVTPAASLSDCLYGYACLYEHAAFGGRVFQANVPGFAYYLDTYDFDGITSSARNRVLDLNLCTRRSMPGGWWYLAPRRMAPTLEQHDEETASIQLYDFCA